MQMFVLDKQPYESAKALADVHVRVICREVSMCLSSWYAKNIGHIEELPYRPFNHPVVDQFDNPYTRWWAIENAFWIFMEFIRRFNKEHASLTKFFTIDAYSNKYDEVMKQYQSYITRCSDKFVYIDNARFSFVEKDKGVITGLNIENAVKKYREYYRNKLKTMKVSVTYTKTNKPDWLEN